MSDGYSDLSYQKGCAGLRRPTVRSIPTGISDIPALIGMRAKENSAGEAVVDRFGTIDYATLWSNMEAAAVGLESLGVRPGDRVAASAANGADIIVSFLATQRLGAIWVGINRNLALPEKLYQLEKVAASIFLTETLSDADNSAIRDLPEMRRLVDMEPGQNEWRSLLAEFRDRSARRIDLDPMKPAGIGFTSGTTGFPKAAVHCQHGMLAMATQMAERCRKRGPDLRKGATLPLTILNMQVETPLMSFASGGTCIAMDRIDALGVSEWIKRERVTNIGCAPPTVRDMALRDDIAGEALDTIDALHCGGGATPPELRQAFERKFAKPLQVGFGLTEAPTGIAGALADETPEGASGRPFDHIELAIFDSEGQSVPAGVDGEICFRAAPTGKWAKIHTPMLGYWGQPEETAKTFHDDWLKTGDIGYLDDADNLTVVARAKSVIVRGGANVYPAEIERILKTHPTLTDAIVLPYPDERFGEIVLAVVESEMNAKEELREELIALCRKNLAKYKCPEEWRFYEKLPRNSMQKIIIERVKSMI